MVWQHDLRSLTSAEGICTDDSVDRCTETWPSDWPSHGLSEVLLPVQNLQICLLPATV